MKKILLAFDGTHFSEGAFEFAKKLSENNKILLTGVFLPQVDFASFWGYSGGGMNGPIYVPVVEGENPEALKKSIEKFETLCRKNMMEYRVHKDVYDFSLPELKKETRFADLLIIGSETFYKNLGTEKPNEYMKDALHGVECPVVIVPEKFDFPQTNILTYDGSSSSVFAIKQFAYLFGGLTGNKTILIYVKEKGGYALPDQVNMEELCARHFNDLTLLKLEANPKKYFTTWLHGKKGAIVISGAYGRSFLSRTFKSSFINEVISEHRFPVFIAHQ